MMVSNRKAFGLLAATNGGMLLAIFGITAILDLRFIAPWGYINLVLVMVLVNWYQLDATFPRRQIYAFFNTNEPVLSHEIRFWRRVIFLLLLLLPVAVTLVEIIRPPESTAAIPQAAATPAAAIITAFLASIGWMFQRFEQDKSNRALSTQKAFERFYGEANMSLLDHIIRYTGAVRAQGTYDRAKPLPIEIMAYKPPRSKLRALIAQEEPPSLEQLVDRFFNILNQLAFGIRQGELDFRTIEMIMRPRYVQFSFVFFESIKLSTAAVFDPATGRWRATRRTWEHMLWLTDKFPILSIDLARPEYLVLPPDHIIGSKDGEAVAAPGDGNAHGEQQRQT